MKIKRIEFTGLDALLILKVGEHELHISYDNGYRFDHEFLFVSEHLKDGTMLALTQVDFTALTLASTLMDKHGAAFGELAKGAE